MSGVIVEGPLARRRGPLGESTARYEWAVEVRALVEGGREAFFLVLAPQYRARVGGLVLPALEVAALVRMIRAGAPLKRIVEAPLEVWGALPRWLRRRLAREVLPIVALFY